MRVQYRFTRKNRVLALAPMAFVLLVGVTFGAVRILTPQTHAASADVQIANCDDLIALSDGNDGQAQRNYTIELTADINCEGKTGFTPLFSDYNSEDNTETYGFSGEFNGNGHTISNLAINAVWDTSNQQAGYGPTALFGYVAGAYIHDFTLVADVAGDDCVGGIAGSGYGFDIEEVEVAGSITTNTEETGTGIGGLVGCVTDGPGYENSIYHSRVSATIYGAYGDNMGGFVGDARISNGGQLRIRGNSENAGAFIINDMNVAGGLVGYASIDADGLLSIHDSKTVGVDNQGGDYVGGVVGYATAKDGGQVEIYNVEVTGAVKGNSYVGGVAGQAESNKAWIYISDEHITKDVVATGMYAGGVIGAAYAYADADGNKAISISSSTVDNGVSGERISGGIIGYSDGYNNVNTNTVIEMYQVHKQGNVTTTNFDAGGIVGRAYETSISETSFDGNVSVTTSTDAGGLIGYAVSDNEISNSYARGTVYTATGIIGGLVGTTAEGFLHITNSYAANSAGTYDPAYSTTAVDGIIGNTDWSIVYTDDGVYWNSDLISQPGYHTAGTAKTTEQLLNATTYSADYDFDTVWGIDSEVNDGYPCLQWETDCSAATADSDSDGILDKDENLAPNNGDGNNDGTADSQQSDVTSFVSPVTHNYVTLAVSGGVCAPTSATVTPEGVNDEADTNYDYQTGFLDFSLQCMGAGQTMTITQYYYNVNSINGLVARKYNGQTGVYSTITGHDVSLSRQMIGGQSVAILSYSITDGDELDEDGLVNGVIDDPVGLATLVGAGSGGAGGAGAFDGDNDGIGAPNTGLQKSADTVAVAATGLAGMALLIAAGVVVRRFVSKK